MLKNKKYQSTDAQTFNDNLKECNLAGGGMIVPSAMQQDGLTIEGTATGLSELRPTKDSTEESPRHYGVSEMETRDGLRFFVLNSSYLPKGTPMTVVINKTVNEVTKKEQFGFTLTHSGAKKGAKAVAS